MGLELEAEGREPRLVGPRLGAQQTLALEPEVAVRRDAEVERAPAEEHEEEVDGIGEIREAREGEIGGEGEPGDDGAGPGGRRDVGVDDEIVRRHPQARGAVGERDRGGDDQGQGDAAARELPVDRAQGQAGGESEERQARLGDRGVGEGPVRDAGHEHAGPEHAPAGELERPEEGASLGVRLERFHPLELIRERLSGVLGRRLSYPRAKKTSCPGSRRTPSSKKRSSSFSNTSPTVCRPWSWRTRSSCS